MPTSSILAVMAFPAEGAYLPSSLFGTDCALFLLYIAGYGLLPV